MNKHIVIVGATSGIAEHCARLWLAAGADRVTLVGRDAARTELVAADLRVRAPQAAITTVTGGFLTPAEIEATVAEAVASGVPNMVLVAHGVLPDQAACQADTALADAAIQINAVSPALFAEAFARRMAQAGGGTLGLIGSVAGDRGRKSNYVYGASKGLLDRYAEGLQHRFAAGPVRVVMIKPGPTDTAMTAHLKATGAKLADPADVARSIVDGMAAGRPVVYAPGKWRVIMAVIRHLPRAVFNRMDI